MAETRSFLIGTLKCVTVKLETLPIVARRSNLKVFVGKTECLRALVRISKIWSLPANYSINLSVPSINA